MLEVAPRSCGGNIRPIRIEGDFAFVPLTKGYEAKIDASDVALVSGRNWSATIIGKTKKRVYAVCGVSIGPGKTRLVYMHRVLCDGPNVDHRDHDTLNNTRANLRSCSTGENNRNTRVRSDSALRLKGVYPDNRRGGFRTAVRLNGRTVYQGHFETIDEARVAYDREARKAFGDFAFVNGGELP